MTDTFYSIIGKSRLEGISEGGWSKLLFKGGLAMRLFQITQHLTYSCL